MDILLDLNFKNLTLYLSKFLYIKYIHEQRQNIEKTLKITIAFFFFSSLYFKTNYLYVHVILFDWRKKGMGEISVLGLSCY